MNQDKSPVRLKGVGNTLCLSIDPAAPLEILQREMHSLLEEIKDLTPDRRVTIETRQQEGHEALVGRLSEFLKTEFGIQSTAHQPKKHAEEPLTQPRTMEQHRRQDMENGWHQHQSDMLLMAGRVRSGQKVTSGKHLVILGDVNPGAEVMAGGDIIVLGTLMGTAIAGQPENDGSVVIALDFRPTQIQIASYVAAGLPSSPEKIIEFAHVENGNIVVESYLEANLFRRLPWPEIR